MTEPSSTGTSPRWEFWIDVGGTFTDCLARSPAGQLLRRKVLSSAVVKGRARIVHSQQIEDEARTESAANFWRNYSITFLDSQGQARYQTTVVSSSIGGALHLADPLLFTDEQPITYELASGEESPILAIRLLLNLRLDQKLPPVSVRLGTTRGTNALLTRRGARTALVTTKGFGDALYIGYQDRPSLFDLNVRRPAPLYQQVVELNERINADGSVHTALDSLEARERLAQIKNAGVTSVAICLLNAYANSTHEQMVASAARELEFEEVVVSTDVAPLIKLVARGDTAVLNAYLNPVLRGYVQRIQNALPVGSDLRLMTSAGGLVLGEAFQGNESILSGPAGGVVGFSRVAEAAGYRRAIGFDMGGTSTDVARFDGRFELQYESEKAGVRVVAPMMAIETVAAGGGSICWFDGAKLRVGPDSAGADPGPACYGRGGPLTVTDLNVYLGRIPANRFPFPLDAEAIEKRLLRLRDDIHAAMSRHYELPELAAGMLQIADANMAQAIRSISIAKGYDPQEYVLVAFGGAAPQHACSVATLLGIRRILIHPDAGLLSAVGIGAADVVRHKASGVYKPFEEISNTLDGLFQMMRDEALAEVVAEGILHEHIEIHDALDLRFAGLDAYLTIPRPPDGDFRAAYFSSYQQLYGHCPRDRCLEVVTARVEVVGRTTRPLPTSAHAVAQRTISSSQTARAFFAGQFHITRLYDRDALNAGDSFSGPAIVHDPFAAIIVSPGWRAELLTGGELLLTSEDTHELRSIVHDDGTNVDPIALEIFHRHFADIATQMGITLRNTSASVNVKERFDYSCAVFTDTGDLVANAPHIPVHLGAMGESVKAVLRENANVCADDVFVTNDPYRGGSHLPDITVISPVFAGSPARLAFFTASRAHHAEIGGIAPGSMPPQSRNLAEEGVLIRNFRLVKAGRMQWDEMRSLLQSGDYPSRNVETNLADMAAQVAANRQGAHDLHSLVQRCGLETVIAYTRHIQLAAERKMRMAIAQLPDGVHHFVDHLDDNSPIAVSITIRGDEALVDFEGTGKVLPGNLNANRAIVTAAVMYSFRCLLNEDIPLNQGVLAPITIRLPECLLNPCEGLTPADSPAVAGGNVETSQRVVDVVLGALGAAAASQGTMNNFTFGDQSFGYYETICGGAGATATGDGESAVHTHMTNTRLTDPEVLELRFPARVLEFSIRRGSGGRGARRGGDGALRRIEFLRPLQVSLVTQRRGKFPPFGLEGGKPGSIGRNRLIRAGGIVEDLPNTITIHVAAGDILEIATPGGGGWGLE